MTSIEICKILLNNKRTSHNDQLKPIPTTQTPHEAIISFFVIHQHNCGPAKLVIRPGNIGLKHAEEQFSNPSLGVVFPPAII